MYFRFQFVILLTVLTCVLTGSSAGASSSAAFPPPATVSPPGREPVDYVNPLVGTASTHAFSNGNTYPTVARPFGMTAWTPQTGMDSGWVYRYGAKTINGLKATHQPSPWIGDYGHFSFMPVVGELKTHMQERASSFSHEREISQPYYYGVELDDYDTTAELTATERCGFLRLTYPESRHAHLVLEVFRTGEVKLFPREQKITGVARFHRDGAEGPFGCYFGARVDRPFSSWGCFSGRTVTKTDKKACSNGNVGAYIGFETSAGDKVHVMVGTSFISLKQAELNLEREIGSKSFSRIKWEGRKAWNEQLSKIRIEGGDGGQLTTFYTAFYRSLLFPRMFYEFDSAGRMKHYSPYDGQIHAGEMYTDTGFWDTFRAVFPLFTILFPDRDASMIRAWINAYREGGWFPKWPSPGYRDCMIGTHVESVVVDAWTKGIRDFDIDTAYEACIKDATDPTEGGGKGRRGLVPYFEKGYVPCDLVKEATARTLEFAYDDWCIARLAEALGKTVDARLLFKQAQNYRNVFDPAVGFMRGRMSDGSWRDDFDPAEWGGPFTEGCSWHYTWSVLHDVQGLIDLMGGDELFVRRLDEMMETKARFTVGSYGRVIHEMSEMLACRMGQYAHGNQPVHHVLYLYNYAGQPWKGARRIRNVVDTLYGPGPDGLCGDEDNGQMSAWYLFSVLGFYPVSPGHPSYVIGSPRFTKVTLDLPGGKTFRVIAHRNSDRNMYIQGARLNGQPLERSWILHQEIVSGGTLEFDMGPEPNREWGREPQNRPYSMSGNK